MRRCAHRGEHVHRVRHFAGRVERDKSGLLADSTRNRRFPRPPLRFYSGKPDVDRTVVEEARPCQPSAAPGGDNRCGPCFSDWDVRDSRFSTRRQGDQRVLQEERSRLSNYLQGPEVREGVEEHQVERGGAARLPGWCGPRRPSWIARPHRFGRPDRPDGG
jgi:hypothetical protein